MMNNNEKAARNLAMSQEDMMCRRIEGLYEQMVNTTAGDADYRAKLVHELLQFQKEDGSFSVIDNYRCDSDIRVVYIYYPTYFATAAIIYAMTFDGSNTVWRNSLVRGFAVATRRKLAGHGVEATRQQLEALNIYKKANLYDFLQKFGDEFVDFRSMICQITESYRRRLMANDTISDWMVDFRSQFETEVEDYDMHMTKNVWYVSYGSNINMGRFMEYIRRCTDTTAPVQSKPITIAHNIYFAGNSITWERKGTAFLDDTCPGMSLGRMYLITYAQFAEIQDFEGAKYSKRIQLGTEDGLPIYTFTAPTKYTTEKSPSKKYMDTILAGLKEAYPDISETTLVTYLLDSGIVNADDRRILGFVYGSEHGVSLQTISNHTVAVTRTKKSIKKLVELGILKQDSRSIAAGHQITSNEAVFYTNKNYRDAIILLMLMHR